MIKKIIKSIIKILFGDKFKYIKRFLYDPKKRGLTELFLEKKYIVTQNNNKIFSLRDMGGSTAARGRSFFSKEPDTIGWINNFNDNANFIDIGANIGIFSLYAAYKGHKVISFEPESLNFALLNLNIFDNNFSKQIKPYPFSIHSADKISELEIPVLHWGKSGSKFDSDIKFDINTYKKKHSQGSYGISFDNFINKTSFIPNYIKIDVDGHELEVVKGMNNFLNNHSDISLLIEIDERQNDHITILQILEKASLNFKSKRIIYENVPIYNYIFNKY